MKPRTKKRNSAVSEAHDEDEDDGNRREVPLTPGKS